MQVSRKSHRWPFVVALVGLLVFCLTVPKYWRSDAKRDDKSLSSAIRSQDVDAPDATWPSSFDLEPREFTLQALANDVQFRPFDPSLVPSVAQLGFPNVAWPTPADVLSIRPRLDVFEISAPQTVFPGWLEPHFTAVLSELGRQFAERPVTPISGVARWTGDIAGLLGTTTVKWSLAPVPITPIDGPSLAVANAADSGPSSTLRFFEPEPRLAMSDTIAQDETASELRITTSPAASSATEDNLDDAVWSTPEVLLSQIEHLTHYSHTESWALNTLERLRALVEGDRRDRSQAAALLAALSESSEEAVRLADHSPDERLSVELLRAHWGLERRLAYWTVMRDIRVAAISEARLASRALGLAFHGWTPDPATDRNLESLSAELEVYERFRDPHVGRLVTQAQRDLQSSRSDLDRALADAVEENYRNANVRVAISESMLNRFLAQERVQSAPVQERIVGTPVRGQSETISTSRVALEPAKGRWQLQLTTDGAVESETKSLGRANVYTYGNTYFTAQTPVVVGPDGNVFTSATDVATRNHAHLVGVSTSVDWVPVVGAFARNQVVKEYYSKRPQAKSEIEFKVANRAREQVDTRTGEMVGDFRGELKDRFTDPLARFGIEITPIEMTTTNERIVVRLRIASSDQLAAHTPRPRALSDSLASMQIHESAMTNAAVALELNGDRMTATQLQARLRQKLPRLANEVPTETRDDTIFQFAPADAIRFRIDGGKLELLLTVAEFSQPGARVRNFIVHAFYMPRINGFSAEFVRDGALGIEGAIGGAERARLHNVFNVVLSEDRKLPILRPDNPSDPRLSGLMITQLVLEDGWMGLSVGPAQSGRLAERQRSLR